MGNNPKENNFENSIKYNSKGYYVKNKKLFRFSNKKITVVMPVYNAENTIENTIESVMNQTIGFTNIEFILVDDYSNDKSREIILEFAMKYNNVIAVLLEKNTGSPAEPRNLGIELASSKYITFLDSDDRLASDGLEKLFRILEETNDDYVVGKTIKEEDKKQTIVGEHQSIKERRKTSPFSIPHIFHHLGPTARMMKTKMLKKNNIRFPKLRYAEDKQFFIDVLIYSNSISTTTSVIYYTNRFENNKESLTNQTDIFERQKCNIKVIDHVISHKISEEKKFMILTRLFEFDSIDRFFNRNHYFISEEKNEYHEIFTDVLKRMDMISYDFHNHFFNPINIAAICLFKEARYADMKNLLKWNRTDNIKKYSICGNKAYIETPFEDNYALIEMPILAVWEKDYFENNQYTFIFKVYGDLSNTINKIFFRKRSNSEEGMEFNVNRKDDGFYYFSVDIKDLESLNIGKYAIFLRYHEYRKVTISILNESQIENQLEFGDKIFDFYTTIKSNAALNIIEKEKLLN